MGPRRFDPTAATLTSELVCDWPSCLLCADWPVLLEGGVEQVHQVVETKAHLDETVTC